MKKITSLLALFLLLTALAGCGKPASTNQEKPLVPPAAEPENTEGISYCGVYRGEQNIYLRLTQDGDSALELYYEQCTNNATRIAIVEDRILIADIKNDQITFAYEDSWGNTGTISMTFHGDSVTCVVEQLAMGEGAMYGIAPGTKLLTKE